MTKVLILGANGQIARVATALFLKHPDVYLTLFFCGVKWHDKNEHFFKSGLDPHKEVFNDQKEKEIHRGI